MTMVELKRQVLQLSAKERRELNAFLIRLRHETPAWKRETARRIKAMQAGRYVTVEELKKRITHG